MKWWQRNKRAAAVVGLTLVIPLAGLIYFLADFWVMRAGYQDEIDRLIPRIARLKGLAASGAQLTDSSGNVADKMRSLVYSKSDDQATLAASLQRDVRGMFSLAGLSVSDSRVLPPRAEDGFDRIGLNVTVTGGMVAIDMALQSLSAYMPLIVIESVDIKPDRVSSRTNASQQTVTASLRMFALKESS